MKAVVAANAGRLIRDRFDLSEVADLNMAELLW